MVPASLRLAWAEELAKWLPHVRPSQVHVIEGRTDRLSGSELPQVRTLRFYAQMLLPGMTIAKAAAAQT